jgi:hypothetical protein
MENKSGSEMIILFVGIVIGLVCGTLAGANVATASFKDLAYKIEAVKVYENKCRYEVKGFRFI